MFVSTILIAALAGTVTAGTVLWDGRFNDLNSCEDLDKWTFANPVGPYQYYIHGSGPVDRYVNLSPDFKNHADHSSNKGARLTIDDTSHWWNQPQFETELIPNTKAPINSGKVYYHFSLKATAKNWPDATKEHHICFFQNHFTQLLYGTAAGAQRSDCHLRWAINDTVHWEAELLPDQWHNIAYEVDFSAQTAAFYHSVGAADLVLTAGPLPFPAHSDAWDWHVGIQRLANPDNSLSGPTEDWYFSGIYIESAPLTTCVTGPRSSNNSSPNTAQMTTTSGGATVASVMATPAAPSTTTLEYYTDSSRSDLTVSSVATAYSAAGAAAKAYGNPSTTTLAVYSADRPGFTPSTIATAYVTPSAAAPVEKRAAEARLEVKAGAGGGMWRRVFG